MSQVFVTGLRKKKDDDSMGIGVVKQVANLRYHPGRFELEVLVFGIC